MFRETLQQVVENIDGAVAGLLMDVEGIPVQSYVRAGISAPFDIEVVGAEFSVIVKSVQRTIDSLEAGDARELAVQAERFTTVIRVVSKDYFVALALEPNGNIGKARYLLRVTAPKLVQEL